MIDIFMKSPASNGLAVIVLIALLITLIVSLIQVLRTSPVETDNGWFSILIPAFSLLGFPAVIDLLQAEGVAPLFAGLVSLAFIMNLIVPLVKRSKKPAHPLVMDWYKWSVLVSVVAGLVVAGYLTFTKSIACGPSSGCEEVQNSRYAILFGFLHVGTLGLIGYAGIFLGWMVLHFGPDSVKRTTSVAVWAMCFFGVLLSTYLTFLEPFVIGATCMWCILSAVLMITLLLLWTPVAQAAFTYDSDEGDLE